MERNRTVRSAQLGLTIVVALLVFIALSLVGYGAYGLLQP